MTRGTFECAHCGEDRTGLHPSCPARGGAACAPAFGRGPRAFDACESAATCVRVARNFEASALELMTPPRPNQPPRAGLRARARQADGYRRRAERTWLVAVVEVLNAIGGRS